MTKDEGDTFAGLDKFGRFHNREELDLLQRVLEPGEVAAHAVEGYVESRKGLLAATDRRVVFVATGLIRPKTYSFPYNELDQVKVGVGTDDAVITLLGRQTSLVVAKAPRRSAALLAEAVKAAVAKASKRYHPVQVVTREEAEREEAARPRTDLEERLDRLDRMLERRSMTEPEHRVARRRLLEHHEGPAPRPRPAQPAAGAAAPIKPGEAGAEVLSRAALPEGTDPMGSYQWGAGRGMTSKPPVQAEEDPGKVLETPPKEARPGAAGRAQVPQERPEVRPIPSASRKPVEVEFTADVPPAQGKPPKPGTGRQVEFESRPVDPKKDKDAKDKRRDA